MLSENGVPVYSLRQNGDIHWHLTPAPHLRGGRLGPSKPGLIRLQATLLENDLGITIGKNLITEKIARQENTLNWLRSRAVLPGLEEYARRSLPNDAVTSAISLNDLRLAEAQAASLCGQAVPTFVRMTARRFAGSGYDYFDAWREMPVIFQKHAPSPRRGVASGCVQPPAHWLR